LLSYKIILLVIKEFHRDAETEKIRNWISPFRFTESRTEILKDVPEGTGTGILKDVRFSEWIEGKGTTGKMKTLWCYGIRMIQPKLNHS
jgi:hypothetical protein